MVIAFVTRIIVASHVTWASDRRTVLIVVEALDLGVPWPAWGHRKDRTSSVPIILWYGEV